MNEHPAVSRSPRLLVIGDIHGQSVQLMSLLLDTGIVDHNLHWTAGDSKVWLVGDLTDRGPDGIGTIDLVMRLQESATAAGGMVDVLLGNHDLLLLMAHRFGDEAVSSVTGLTFMGEWLAGGGQRADLAGMTTDRSAWLARRPAMARIADRLLIHNDALWYMEYGTTVAEVNAAVSAVLASGDQVEWDRLLGAMSSRYAFDPAHGGDPAAARELLQQFGGRQIIHGHTPIQIMNDQPIEEVDTALVYAEGLVVNVDGAMYLGGAGVIFEVHDDGIDAHRS